MSLLAYLPIGCLTPFGMRLLDTLGVRTPLSDMILLSALLLPILGIFLWGLIAETFWSRMLENSGWLRFAVRWAIPIFIGEAAFVALIYHAGELLWPA
jgi:hypothetical protein